MPGSLWPINIETVIYIFYEKEVSDPKGDGGMMVKLDTPNIDTIT